MSVVKEAETLELHGSGASASDPSGGALRLTLDNGSGVKAAISTFGATLLSLTVDGVEMTVRVDKSQLPCSKGTYAGATVGRVANRIALAKTFVEAANVSADSATTAPSPTAVPVKLTPNHGEHMLHGGASGFHARPWSLAEEFCTDEEVGVELRYVSADGEEGFPGALVVSVRYSLARARGQDERAELRMLHEAKLLEREESEDGAARGNVTTQVNVCNHAYWNLSAGAAGIKEHSLRVLCPSYVVVDESSIPSGALAAVAGTPMDFLTESKPIGRDIDQIGRHHAENRGYDHCYCTLAPGGQGGDGGDGEVDDAGSGLKVADRPGEAMRRSFGALHGDVDMAVIAELRYGARTMTVATSQPGVQVYTGNFLPGDARHSAVALETQHLPDTENQRQNGHKRFPSTILRQGETFRHATVHVFTQTGDL